MHQISVKSGKQQPKEKNKSQKNGLKSTSQRYGDRVFFWKGKINFGPEGKKQVATFFGLFFPSFVFMLYESEFKEGLQQEFGSVYWLSICGVVIGVCIYLFLLCSLSDPGYIVIPLSKAKRRQMPQIQQKGGQEFCLNCCSTCNIFRPIRTHHCKICNLCVKERDHHCPFLNNCIGMDNRKSYVYFLLSAVVLELITIAESLYQIIKPFASQKVEFVDGIKKLSVIFAFIQVLIALLFEINILNLFIFQIKLVSKNSTTDELRRLLSQQVKQVDKDIHNIYNQGWIKNMKQIMCCSNYSESIYKYYGALSYSYLKKRNNNFLIKKSNLNYTDDELQKKQQQQYLFELQHQQSFEDKKDEPFASISKKSSEINHQDIHIQENSEIINQSENNMIGGSIRPNIRPIELKFTIHHIDQDKHSVYEQQNPDDDGWDGGDLFGSPHRNENDIQNQIPGKLQLEGEEGEQRISLQDITCQIAEKQRRESIISEISNEDLKREIFYSNNTNFQEHSTENEIFYSNATGYSPDEIISQKIKTQTQFQTETAFKDKDINKKVEVESKCLNQQSCELFENNNFKRLKSQNILNSNNKQQINILSAFPKLKIIDYLPISPHQKLKFFKKSDNKYFLKMNNRRSLSNKQRSTFIVDQTNEKLNIDLDSSNNNNKIKNFSGNQILVKENQLDEDPPKNNVIQKLIFHDSETSSRNLVDKISDSNFKQETDDFNYPQLKNETLYFEQKSLNINTNSNQINTTNSVNRIERFDSSGSKRNKKVYKVMKSPQYHSIHWTPQNTQLQVFTTQFDNKNLSKLIQGATTSDATSLIE